jgi:hypothetical protein
MNQEASMRTRVIRGVASATTFVIAAAIVGALKRLDGMTPLGLALASTLVVAGSVRWLRVPPMFAAQFTRPGDWLQHGADFAVAAIGMWAVALVFPSSRGFVCERLVPWRLSIALFGAFAMGWLARAAALRAPGEEVSFLIFVAFFWIAPFYGFFHAPWMLAQAIMSPCAGRPLLQVIAAAAGMAFATDASRRLASWMFQK